MLYSFFRLITLLFVTKNRKAFFIQNANDKLNSTVELKSVINQLISIIYH